MSDLNDTPHRNGSPGRASHLDDGFRTKRLKLKRELMRGARMTKDEADAFDAAADRLGLRAAEFIRMLVQQHLRAESKEGIARQALAQG